LKTVVFGLYLALYLALGLRTGRTFFAWDEETMVQAAPAPALFRPTLSPTGAARLDSSCRAHDRPHTFWLPDRPHWNLCYAGRIWPVMFAAYLGGLLHWPIGVLGALLGDDLLRRRALSTALGLIALLAGVRLAREVEGEDAALPTAMALATTPAFVLVHALLLHYETLPSTLLLVAGLVFARGVRDGRPLSPARLWVVTGLVGLTLLANLRFSLMLVAIGLTAWRLRAPVHGLRPRHWLVALGVLPLAMAPTLLYPLLSPPGLQGDRMSSLPSALTQNLLDPSVFLYTGYDLLRWWSNFADYLFVLRGAARFSAPALAIAACALGWVLWEGLRALWRREGSPLAAMLALSLLGFWSTSALIYSSFPRNLAPLHAVFGMSLGLTLTRLVQLARALHRRVGPALALGLCVLLTLPFMDSIEQLTRVSRVSYWPSGLGTERAIVAWLVDHPLPGSRLVVLNSQMYGVLEGLSAGAVRPVYAEPLFWRCDDRGPACFTQRMAALLRWSDGQPLRLVLVAPDSSTSDKPSYEATRALVRAAGGQVVDEFSALTPMGTEGMLLLRITPPAPVARSEALR
jgi:hypothetical protein